MGFLPLRLLRQLGRSLKVQILVIGLRAVSRHLGKAAGVVAQGHQLLEHGQILHRAQLRTLASEEPHQRLVSPDQPHELSLSKLDCGEQRGAGQAAPAQG